MRVVAILFASSIALVQSSAASDADSVPTASEVIARLMHQDAVRQNALAGYTATRRYTLNNKNRHASMLVLVTVGSDGARSFAILEESGSGAVRKHVLHKLIEEESAASTPQRRKESQLSPDNYLFQSEGVETLNRRRAWVIDLVPKKESKYLINGRVWIDAEEYAVMRIEGHPAKNPSFWTKSVRFVHEYEKNGSFWFPLSNRSETDVRIFGRADLTIEYFDYAVNPRMLSASTAPPGLR